MKRIILPIILLLLSIIYYFSFNYVYTTAVNEILTQQVENSKVQASLISNLLYERLNSGIPEKQVREELQKSLENMSTENSFVCMFDGKGKEICHPDIRKIGVTLTENNSTIKSISNLETELNFKKAILERKEAGGLRTLKSYTEIVYLSPVKNMDWVVASHSNILNFQSTFDNLKEKLALIFIVVWLSSSLLIYFFLQYINSKNLKRISEINRNTGNQYFNDLKEIKNKITSTALKSNPSETKRILADRGNKLTPVYFENIAFVYTQNKITYIVEQDHKTSTINISLDDLYVMLDNSQFYRASRQVIVSAKAIDKIEKYGATQLKVFTKPIAPIDITISKAKITEFKKWLGQN
ncbi:MAG: hypothetical protein COB12_12745 [Flavobacterium sp.]|nr:MAG: hypothetical protein COB12_12745 [Flavobacterium sp.]